MELASPIPSALTAGSWQAVAGYEYAEGRWLRGERFRPGDLVWTFRPDGILVERSHEDGDREHATRYEYRPHDCGLRIDCSDYEPDGFTFLCAELRYRILRLGPSLMLLEDMDDADEQGMPLSRYLFARRNPQ